MNLDLAALAREAEALDALCGGDERLFHDMMQGETQVERIVRRIHEQLARDQEMLTGIKARQADLAQRKARIEARWDGAKTLIGKVLRIARLPKLELPEVTYLVRDGNSSLVIVDEKAVPEVYCINNLVPDKKEINSVFADANNLPNWLVRKDARDIVTARTK